MYDACLNQHESVAPSSLHDEFNKPYILCTIHRAENTNYSHKMANIVQALVELSSKYRVIFPMHPRTVTSFKKYNLYKILLDKINIISPQPFSSMQKLEQASQLIITDSGGLQKEAYFNRKPCITLRDETEWVELLDSGWNILCSTSEKFDLLSLVDTMINKSSTASYHELYGKGNAGELIIKEIKKFINAIEKN